jgi:hypothetical protein
LTPYFGVEFKNKKLLIKNRLLLKGIDMPSNEGKDKFPLKRNKSFSDIYEGEPETEDDKKENNYSIEALDLKKLEDGKMKIKNYLKYKKRHKNFTLLADFGKSKDAFEKGKLFEIYFISFHFLLLYIFIL